MGATPDYNKPAWANPIDTDLDSVRNNFHFLMCQVATGIPILPGWDTTVDVATNSNYAKPDGYVLSHTDGRKIYINLVWSGTLISQITLGYDDGISSPGLVWFDPVTLTIAEAPAADPRIIWAGAEFESVRGVDRILTDINFYETANGIPSILPTPYDSTCWYYTGTYTDSRVRVISNDAGAGSNVPFTTGVFIVKYEVVSILAGSPTVYLNTTAGREGQWWDLYRCNIQIWQTFGVSPLVKQSVRLNVTVAVLESGDPSTGNGVPVAGTEVTRSVVISIG